MALRTARWLKVAGAVVVVVVLAGLVIGANAVSDLLTTPQLVDPEFRNNQVHAVDGDLVTIGAGTGSSVAGSRWGLLSDDGQLRMVELVERDGGRVTWRVEGPSEAFPEPGDAVLVYPAVDPGDPSRALDLPFESVTVDGPVGPVPTWVVPATSDRRGTVVYLHGAGSSREEATRYLPALTSAGWEVVVPAYRGDEGEGAAPWPEGRFLLGTRAWADLEAVVAVTTADDDVVVLFGASLGGAMIGQFMDRSPLAGRVDGIVLDGPLLSLDATMRFHASRVGVPDLLAPVLVPLGQLVADVRHGMDSASLEQVADDGTFDLPTLLIICGQDMQEPIEPMEQLARLEDQVQVARFETAGHLVAWNHEPQRFERVLTDFLDALPPTP